MKFLNRFSKRFIHTNSFLETCFSQRILYDGIKNKLTLKIYVKIFFKAKTFYKSPIQKITL